MALTGNLSETSFTDLIQFYSISRQTAAVRIVSPAGPEHDGVLYIEGGDVVDASFGELTGLDAVRRALRLKDGEFRVEMNVRASRRTVFEPWSRLVLEEMVSEDEAHYAEALSSRDDFETSEELQIMASDSLDGPRYCPLCSRRYQQGTVCIDDGTELVVASPASTSTTRVPTPGDIPASPSRVAAISAPPRKTMSVAGAQAAAVSTPPRVLSSVPGPARQTQPRPARSEPPVLAKSEPPFARSDPPIPARSEPPTPARSEPPTPARSEPPIPARTEPPPFAKTAPPPPTKRGRPLWLVGIVVALAAAAAVVVILGKRATEAANQRQADDTARETQTRVRAQTLATEARRPQGVTDTEIVVGMSGPFSGPAKELGRGVKTGIDVAFAAVNEAGGVNGRKLRLLALDDGYEPERTRAVMKELSESRKVFAFIGNVGTPTAEVSVPYALDRKQLFFGPFTGAGLLRRDPPDRYVFNYRASYAEETAATFKYLVEVKRIKPEEIAVFAQQDGYGDAGFNGVAKMLRKYGRDPDKSLRVGYKRNTSEVGEAIATLLEARPRPRAVVMVATYKAAGKFIDRAKGERPDLIFTNVSFVGSQALADELLSYGPKVAEGVLVTQVVPLPTSKSTAVLKYQELLPKYSLGEKPDFVSLEGYLAAQLFIEGLRRAGREFTTESLIDVLEGLRGVDLGIGAPMSFGMSEHQASHKVWGTVLDASGGFQPVDLE